MPISADTTDALNLLERIQRGMKESDDITISDKCSNDLNTLISVLESPVFRGILNIQDSLKELKRQVSQHPSIVPSDFDITSDGRLVLHIAPDDHDLDDDDDEDLDDVNQNYHGHGSHTPRSTLSTLTRDGRDSSDTLESGSIGVHGLEGVDGDMPHAITNQTLDDELQRTVQLAAAGRDLHRIQLYKPDGSSLGFSVVGLRSEQRGELGIYVQGIQPTGIAAKDGRLQEGDQILAIDGQVLDSYISHQQAIGILQQATRHVDLVVARAPAEGALLGENNINNNNNNNNNKQESSSLEQQVQYQEQLHLQEQLQFQQSAAPTPPQSAVQQDNNNDQVMLNTDWAQVEVIDLVNDGSGLGFGIIGGRSTGVVVKTILPGGVADRDGRLHSGDHILQIGDVNLRGMGSDQVAAVLRQSGSYVRLIVARPIEVNDHTQVARSAPIVETRVLNDPDELDRQLSILHSTFPLPAEAIAAARAAAGQEPLPITGETNGMYNMYTNGDPEPVPTAATTGVATSVIEASAVPGATSAGRRLSQIKQVEDPMVGSGGSGLQLSTEDLLSSGRTFTEEELAAVGDLPEMETIELELHKDHQGLGITIAGYVCEREELSGIFVKSINAGSAADRNGQIQVNDQIVQVDGTSLSGLSNHAAVDVLRATGAVVHLRLARYLRGPKYEQLQQAIANSELKTTPTTPNPPRAPLNDGAASSEALRSALDELEDADSPYREGDEPPVIEAINPGLSSITTIIADVPTLPPAEPDTFAPPLTQPPPLPLSSVPYATNTSVPHHDFTSSSMDANEAARQEDIELMIDNDYGGEIRPSVENAICRKWSRIVGPEFDIVVAQLSKFEEGGGLGISLEGTVDVEGGREVRPHHYIRSILPDGPVGKNSKLQSADELLEVNGQKLLGLNHVEVVGILKELPRDVRLVCGRRAPGAPPPLHPPHAANPQAFAARNILGGSLQSLVPGSERLVKAKSDGSLASSTNNANCDSPWGGASDSSFNRIKSRSLEPLTGLAMWSSQPQIIELNKGDRGLGFSILDYQDPLNPQETVIVIRSLVPGGVAEKDGRLIPGDRLVAVNGTCLENATLDQAVAALKGAPKGPVSIAVAKPISVLESTGPQQQARTPGSEEQGRTILETILGDKGVLSDHENDEDHSQQQEGEEYDNDKLDVPLNQNLVHDDSEGSSSSDIEDKVEDTTVLANDHDLVDARDLMEVEETKLEIKHRSQGSVLSTCSTEVPPLPPTSPPHTPEHSMMVLPSLIAATEITDVDNEPDSQETSDEIGLSLDSPPTLLPPPITQNPDEVVSPISIHKASVLMVPVATERLLGGSVAPTSISAMTTVPPPPQNFATPNTTTSSVDEEDLSPQMSPSMGRWAAHAPVLPKDLERTIKIKKGADQLGVNIEVVDHGVNGVVVSSLVRNGAVHKDGRLHAGDFILSVNNESMRNITNSQARAILRRTQLVSTDVSITYIPGQEAAVHREASLLQYQQQQQQQLQEEKQTPLQHQTSPRIFPKYYRSPFIPLDSSEEETPGGESSHGDLTRSITAPSFITRELRSRDPSHEDLLKASNLPANHIEEGDAPEALTVIKIKHALSETSIEKRTDDNVSSVIICGDDNKQTDFSGKFEDGSEEGPFTITFKNVSEAQSEFSTSTEELQAADEDLPVADDHEVDSVLQGTDSIRNSASSPGPNLDGKHWGPERTVEVRRDDKNSLGISIVGGKVDLSWSGTSVTGIFIKNVLPSSPAGKSGLLKTGDRILEVEGQDLRGATHEKAVEIIKKTGNPVSFKVQSLVQWTPANTPVNSRPPSRNVQNASGNYLAAHAPHNIPVNRTPSPELIQAGLSDIKKQEIQNNISQPRVIRRDTTESQDSDDGLDPNDERYEQGRVEAKSGVEIDRASAGALRRPRAERLADEEEEDQFGYTKKKIIKKYGDLKGEVKLVEVQKGNDGLGISLAGHKNRTQMSAFICGMNPAGLAHKQGLLEVGDEILEVNGNVLYNRCHLNACAVFKGLAGPQIKIIVLRSKKGLQEMAVKPLTNFPVVLEDEAPEDRYKDYMGLSNVTIKKGDGGLGIMIIEGKHAKYGKGIFISDLQEGSPADKGGLKVGDMILCVNKDDMSQVDYDKATEILKRTEGVVKVWVCNAARDPNAPQEKKKPDIPPKPVIGPKPTIPAKPILPLTTTTHPAATHTPASHTPTTHTPTTHTPTTPPPVPLNNDIVINSTQTTPTIQTPQSLTNPIQTEPVPSLQRNNSNGISSNTTSWTNSNSVPANIAQVENKNPAKDPITAGWETTIEITKEKMGLGLSIVGGSDTLLKGAIIIHEVYPDGAAAKDGRLKPGDQILSVNAENFREITHQKALSVLRQTPSKVKMLVYREEGTTKEEDMYEIITVNLTKKSGKGLGLSIVGRKNGPGVFISDVVPGGVAEAASTLMQGDQILAVNDKDLKNSTQEQAAAVLKCAPGAVTIKLGRLKPGKKNNNALWPVCVSEGSSEGSESTSPEPPVPVPRSSHPPGPPNPQGKEHLEALGIRTILLERGDDGLGFSIVGGFGSNLGDLPIYVKSVFERGAAAREGTLRRGDQILEVNGESLAGLTHGDAVSILKEARGSVALTILPSK